MRIHSLRNLVYLYNTFFIRKILNLGVLKHPLVRVMFLMALLLVIAVMTFSIFTFFSETLRDEETVLFILNAYSSTIILWTLAATIFLKIVFSRMDNFLKMTINFPVTNKERNFSIFLYETLICIIILVFLSFAVVTSMFLITGLEYVDVMLVNILYGSTLTYMGVQLLSKSISYMLTKIRLIKIFHIVNVSVLVMIFVLFLKEAQQLITSLSVDFINGTRHSESLLLFLQDFHNDYGFGFTSLFYVLVTGVLLALIILIPDESYMAHSRYILLFPSRKADNSENMFSSILKSYTRDSNIVNTIVLVYLSSFVLLYSGQYNYIIYPIILLVFNAIYSFVQSDNLRKLSYQVQYNPLKDYIALITSQIYLVYGTSLPLFITAVVIGAGQWHLILPYVIATLGIFLFVMAGILFPPYEDNPFSIITSILVITVPILLSAVALSFLNMGTLVNASMIVIFYILVIFFSVQGLINLRKGVRYENDSTND